MEKKKAAAREIWLQYFNEYLYKKQLITEDERNKMRHKIRVGKP
jgi:hypothetical protein